MAKSIPRPHPRSLSPRPPFSPPSHRTRAPRNLESAKPDQTGSTSYGYKPVSTRKETGMMISGSRNNQSFMTADDTADFSAPTPPSRLANNSIFPDDNSLEVSRIMNSDANPQSEDASWNIHRHVGGDAIGARGVAMGTDKGVFPPVSEVRVSKEEEEEDYVTLDQPNRSYSSETRIYVAPHLVPDSPTKRRQKDDSQIVVTGHSLEETLDLDSSGEILDGNRSQLVRSFSYDAEESCMINDIGVDSEHGRVHYPLAWTKHDGSLAATACRDIVVTRPFRIAGTESEKTVKTADVSFSTGNESRDDVMARARALLDAHGHSVKRWNPSDSEVDSEGEEGSLLGARNDVYDEDLLLEDGLAPLGGSWSLSRESWEEPKSVTELLGDPMNHLPDIHQVASKQLLANNFVDSLPLFSIILQCQRRRNGPVHADVASALHNVGICQLRANNHDEALQAFEESARIRKGSLGRDHPFVAVSLVKVGITLLLLHRFEDALWSFREALSVRKHALGPLHPSTARIYNNIGCVHVEFNEFREARRAFEAALDIQRNAICHDPDSGPLLFAAATTLCNLGYLYRYRDLHEKAALVLKEAWEMQETVLGQSHATVLSTLDNLADSCANCGQTPEALRFYNIVLKRFRVGGRTESQKVLHAEAVLLYKMSRVHRQRDDHASQLDSLKLALRSIRAYSDTASLNGIRPDTLERRILYDIRACREQMEKEELNWV
jgi:tetratricopeptide (TPR) repeat protein